MSNQRTIDAPPFLLVVTAHEDFENDRPTTRTGYRVRYVISRPDRKPVRGNQLESVSDLFPTAGEYPKTVEDALERGVAAGQIEMSELRASLD
ncbi:hypothetical protein [Pandoraea bronchicola]|uniref:Uncharacterized protein n=1 Tax=Pandoraea bronchicola TaxID=2508287 RepID=A0A5E5BZA5_9BURK|nr:hypothetical protein [Pandoraea bronchicola]VVE90305.1 hypothetical protein PBR20603_04287 [Pandoraea bronchicola]